MPTNLPYPSNPSQPLSPTQEGHVSWLVQALVIEEEETVRINGLADPISRRCAEQERTYFSCLDDRAFLDFQTFGRMTPRTVIQTIYQAFMLGYVEIQDTRRQPNPEISDDEEKGQVAERFRQVGLIPRPHRHVKGYRISLTDIGRSFVQALRASREGDT